MSEVAAHTNGSATVVLVHGAFAGGSSWKGVIERLQEKGVNVTVPANPLRGVSNDVVRSMAERAGASTTEFEGSHVIMVSQPQAVADVILEAVSAVGAAVAAG